MQGFMSIEEHDKLTKENYSDRIVIRVFDTETTGMPEKGQPNDHQVVEAAYHDVLYKVGHGTSILCSDSTLFNITRDIDVEALATHHITRDMCKGGHAIEFSRGWMSTDAVQAYAAHNLPFDEQFLDLPESALRIDTLKCARTIWRDAPRHTNQVLRYWLGLDLDPVLCEPAHRALPDTYVTAQILMVMLRDRTPQELAKMTAEPFIHLVMPFGKHKGVRLVDLEHSYLRWAKGVAGTKDAFEPDLELAINREWNRRHGG